MSSADLAIAAGYIAILGSAGLLAYFATLRWTGWRGIARSIAAFFVTALGVWAICVLLWTRPAAEVRIESPREAARVEGPWISVEGTVSPPNASVRLLVHPSSTGMDQPWWVQPPPKRVHGAWKGDIHLGTSALGDGEYFQIIAVASPRPRWVDLLHYQWLGDAQQLDRLPALPRSEIVTVWRVR